MDNSRNQYDALDLIIEFLRDHEKRMDNLINRLEEITFENEKRFGGIGSSNKLPKND